MPIPTLAHGFVSKHTSTECFAVRSTEQAISNNPSSSSPPIVPTQTIVPGDGCDEQKLKLDLMFTVASFAVNIAAFPVGLFLDRSGPQVHIMFRRKADLLKRG